MCGIEWMIMIINMTGGGSSGGDAKLICRVPYSLSTGTTSDTLKAFGTINVSSRSGTTYYMTGESYQSGNVYSHNSLGTIYFKGGLGIDRTNSTTGGKNITLTSFDASKVIVFDDDLSNSYDVSTSDIPEDCKIIVYESIGRTTLNLPFWSFYAYSQSIYTQRDQYFAGYNSSSSTTNYKLPQLKITFNDGAVESASIVSTYGFEPSMYVGTNLYRVYLFSSYSSVTDTTNKFTITSN